MIKSFSPISPLRVLLLWYAKESLPVLPNSWVASVRGTGPHSILGAVGVGLVGTLFWVAIRLGTIIGLLFNTLSYMSLLYYTYIYILLTF